MRDPAHGVRVLVVSDNTDDAQQIVHQLRPVFDAVRSAIVVAADGAATLAAVDAQVLVLAFDTLDKAQACYLGLYRHGNDVLRLAHRTVVLCNKDEARRAFDLCLANHFDDYVLYWPLSYDGGRLAMSVWVACRQLVPALDAAPSRAALQRHVDHLADLEGAVADPASASVGQLRERIEPSLAGTRPLAEALRHIRPVVLVVDDDEFSRRLVRQALDPARWQALFAADGAATLSSLRHTRPDVILMDIRLPDTDGIALTRRLKALSHLAGIPVIMMTGDSRRETLVSSMEAGAVGFVVKPVVRAALEERLAAIFDRAGDQPAAAGAFMPKTSHPTDRQSG